VIHEIGYTCGDEEARRIVEEHDDVVTYGENIGTQHCPVPPLPKLRARTRQPVLLDQWRCGPPMRREFTTVGNWKQAGPELDFRGETYLWSKHHEFLKVLDVPRRAGQPVELATNLAEMIDPSFREVVAARTLEPDARALLLSHGWKLTDARALSTDPWRYWDYVTASPGEFTVARDLNVRLQSGWFSERSACYLAAGRPVVTQDTGFGAVLPTCLGLFGFNTADEAVAALVEIRTDYDRHSLAARAIAEEFFRAETVLAKLLEDLGL
jgi:hypothetical protein